MKNVYPFSKTSKSALGPAQPPSQLYIGVLPRGWSSRVVTLFNHLHLAPRLKL